MAVLGDGGPWKPIMPQTIEHLCGVNLWAADEKDAPRKGRIVAL